MPGTITGKHILYDVSLTVNTIDLSDHVESVTFEVMINKQDGAAMGDLQDYSIPGTQVVSDPVATFYQDFAASKVYATMFAAWQNRTLFDVVGKASSGATSTTNPQWTIPSFLQKAPIMTGKRGDRHMAPVTFAVNGALTVATS